MFLNSVCNVEPHRHQIRPRLKLDNVGILKYFFIAKVVRGLDSERKANPPEQ